jgi:4-hydroxybenzoate polyprenyltransferase
LSAGSGMPKSKIFIIHFLVCLTSFIFSLFCLTRLNSKVIFAIIPALIIAAAYFFPLIKTSTGWRTLRSFALLKFLWIGLAFSCMATFVPLSLAESPHLKVSPFTFLLFFENLLFILPACIAYDIRDYNIDKERGFKTLPVALGVNNATAWSFAMLLVFLILVFIHLFLFSFSNIFVILSLLIPGVLAMAATLNAKPSKTPLFFPFVVEGCVALQWLLPALFRLIVFRRF